MHRAVKATFPGFGYLESDVDRFLSLNAEPYDDAHYFLQKGGQVLAVAMRCGDLLEYVVPATWERRYEIVNRTVLALKAEHPGLRVHIGEDPPSHAAWYAALLPALGFGMTPRFRMVASVASLRNAAVPEAAFSLTPMQSRWIDACVALHLKAHRLSGPKAEEMSSNLRESIDSPDRLGSWVIALEGEAVVGSCFGSHHRGRLFVEEIAVAETHQNRGLGRALLIETIRKLSQDFSDAETAVLDVDRTNVSAVHLYTRIGFSVQNRYTIARSDLPS